MHFTFLPVIWATKSNPNLTLILSYFSQLTVVQSSNWFVVCRPGDPHVHPSRHFWHFLGFCVTVRVWRVRDRDPDTG